MENGWQSLIIIKFDTSRVGITFTYYVHNGFSNLFAVTMNNKRKNDYKRIICNNYLEHRILQSQVSGQSPGQPVKQKTAVH